MTELKPGLTIGPYHILRVIGKGGMGTVYEVEHLGLGVHYALKTFSFDPNDEHADILKAKFLEEGKVLARLRHPNIAHVFDLGFEELTFTRPFWMSRTPVTVEQWREFAPNDCEDCAEVEKALDGRALLYIRLSRASIDEFCKFLSSKYRIRKCGIIFPNGDE